MESARGPEQVPSSYRAGVSSQPSNRLPRECLGDLPDGSMLLRFTWDRGLVDRLLLTVVRADRIHTKTGGTVPNASLQVASLPPVCPTSRPPTAPLQSSVVRPRQTGHAARRDPCAARLVILPADLDLLGVENLNSGSQLMTRIITVRTGEAGDGWLCPMSSYPHDL